ncbi:hypothetical protein AB0L05_41280 [Nonomuraea pusilla]|uniref:hypothetical protein n=1 Tax=Nonomuraea pusilla TaxID=46177 RepID=UPI003326B519
MKRFLPAALLLGGVLAAPPASAAAASDVAQLTMPYILAPAYEGQCRPVTGFTASALVTTDRDTEVSYRLVVDGTPGVTRTQQLKAGLRQTIGDFWYSGTTTSVTGTVRIEVLNQNMPFREAPYSITCRQADVPAGGVGVSAFTPMAYYGDCLDAPYVTAHGTFRARLRQPVRRGPVSHPLPGLAEEVTGQWRLQMTWSLPTRLDQLRPHLV